MLDVAGASAADGYGGCAAENVRVEIRVRAQANEQQSARFAPRAIIVSRVHQHGSLSFAFELAVTQQVAEDCAQLIVSRKACARLIRKDANGHGFAPH
jgi:hypothetical protein